MSIDSAGTSQHQYYLCYLLPVVLAVHNGELASHHRFFTYEVWTFFTIVVCTKFIE